MPRKLFLVLALVCVANGQNRTVVAIAHRGEHIRHPENTMPAYRAAVDAGVDFIEVDIRTTADGQLVSMHDETVDRQTNGSGRVSEMTLAQIRALDAGIKFAPQFAGTKVPTFDEILDFVRGRMGIYLDAKQISATDIVASLERHGMENHCVVYGSIELLKRIAALKPAIKVMPEAVSVPVLHMLVEQLRPRVIAFDARDFYDDIIAAARRTKADIYVDRFGPVDNPAGWQNAIERGATGIQTDRPAELVRFLRSKGLHK